MSDCLFHAYLDHMEHLDLYPVSYRTFSEARWKWQGNHANVELAYVYPILRELCEKDHRPFLMQCVYPLSEMFKFAGLSLNTPKGRYLERIYRQSFNPGSPWSFEITGRLTLSPAIYGLTTQQHALFSRVQPLHGSPDFCVKITSLGG